MEDANLNGTMQNQNLERIHIRVPAVFKNFLEGLYADKKDPLRSYKEEFMGELFYGLTNAAEVQGGTFESLEKISAHNEMLVAENTKLRTGNEELQNKLTEFGILEPGTPVVSVSSERNKWKWAFWGAGAILSIVIISLWSRVRSMKREW